MKKKIFLILTLGLVMTVAAGCALMPMATLEAMFQDNPESSITLGGTEPAADGDTVTISRKEYERLQRYAEMEELIEDASTYFYKEIDEDRMLEFATKGLMAGLDDPYTFYYNPQEYADLWEDDKGQYTGIGVQISANYNTQLCVISRVFKDSPAKAAGVMKGDILYRVGEDLLVKADNLQDAVDIMRGVPGTDVEVTFLRDGKELTFTITRQEVTVNEIESTMLDEGIGYIAYYEFSGKSDTEFRDALEELTAQGARGLIIDLRDNPGGWTDQARNVGDLFLDEGIVCYLEYRDGTKDYEDYRTKDGKSELPLVVLVNENSASSSEILTGALRDRAGAVIVGTKSYGKGIVQAVFPVGKRGAGVQMTIAQYFTPNGHSVHGEGITPDVIVERPEGDNGDYNFADRENDPQLQKAFEVMLEKLQ